MTEDFPWFQIRPEWGAGITVEWEYLTDIFTARNGTESRRSLRTRPRRVLDVTVLEQGEIAAEVRAMLARYSEQPVRVPIWVEKVPCSRLPEGVRVSDVPLWARYNRWVAVRTRAGWQPARVVSATNEAIVLDPPPLVDVDAVCPVVVAFVRVSGSVTNPTNRVTTTRLLFSENPTSAVRPVSATDPWIAPGYHRGFPIFPLVPNWASGVPTEYLRRYDEVDVGFGAISRSFPEREAAVLMKPQFLARSAEQTRAAEAIFHTMRGRRGMFYASSWMEDFTILGMSNERNVLHVAGRAAAALLRGRARYQNIAVSTQAGASFVGVVDVTDAPDGGSYLRLDSVLPEALQDAKRASLVYMARFASDTMAVKWLTSEAAEFTMSMLAIREAFYELAVADTRIAIGGNYITTGGPGPTAPFIPFGIHGNALLVGEDWVG